MVGFVVNCHWTLQLAFPLLRVGNSCVFDSLKRLDIKDLDSHDLLRNSDESGD